MIDYTCLGQNTEMRERRYDVLALFIKGATPQETHKILSKQKHPTLTLKQVYNDRLFFTTNPLHNLPAEMARDFNLSFYEVKIRELEVRLDVFKPDSKSWIATQELIRKYKADSLKLQGLMNDKLDVKVDPITVTNIDIDEKLAEKFGNWLATKKEEEKAE